MPEKIKKNNRTGKRIGELFEAWNQEAKEQKEFDRQPHKPCRAFEDLPPNISHVVKQLIGLTPKPANWDHYDLAKVAIRLCCRQYGPDRRFRHDQYDAAIKAYVRAVGL